MATKEQCSFFLLRWVPDAVKNEFINIGLVLLSGTGVPELRFTEDWSRVRCLDPEADITLLENFQAELREQLREAGEPRESLLRRIQDTFSNSLQASGLTACLAESPAAEADALARIYLERAPRSQTREKSARQILFETMRDEFERAGVWALMNKGISVARYTRSGDPLKIDCGYSAGGRVKMFHALALESDVNSAKILAFSYPRLAEGIRRAEGAEATLTAIVEDDLVRDSAAVGFALETLEQNRIAVAPLGQIPAIALAAAHEMGIA
ncbi:MAG TPA: DUF3037 domain-containing protein [Candidatus Angelobacter sp.]|nr:DUF3037 domain-containing protein [Candidatus Angelobacter sp.]